MEISFVPILPELCRIYRIEDVTSRFEAYVSLVSGKGAEEALPLGMFSPMGKRQPAYLDALMALDAERCVSETAEHVAEELAMLPDRYRLMIVPVDEPRNGWTERSLSDADWRFSAAMNQFTDENAARWVTIQVWTDIDPTETYIVRETWAAIFRAAHQRRHGLPRRLSEMMLQEGRSLAFAGYAPTLSTDEIASAREVLRAIESSEAYPTCFSALYGDGAAKAVGYSPLGLPRRAGFEVALTEAWKHGDHLGTLTRAAENHDAD